MARAADRNLLFGIICVQNGFVTEHGLVQALNQWAAAKHRSIDDILLERGLPKDEHALVSALVAKQIARNEGDFEKGLAHLASFISPAPIRHALKDVADEDVKQSLASFTAPPIGEVAPTFQPIRASDRFRVLRPHARGGLGEVFVAQDVELHREVALKEIQPQFAEDAIARGRFLFEAEVTGGLEHPGVVPVYGLGSYADGRPFYAMRFIKGDNLKQAIARFHEGPGGYDSVEFRALLRRFLDVCNAIGYAHSRGVLHRDLKPGNIMLGPFGETLVVDWGLAKVIGVDMPGERSADGTLRPAASSGKGETLPGSAIGTPAFMSPEQAEGRADDLGPTTDVYALGATLYSLLTGRPPIEGEHVIDVMQRVRKGEITPIEDQHPHVPKPLGSISLRAMALRPSDRYQSADELAREVERWLADEHVLAHRDSSAIKARRWMRKHPASTAGAAAAVVIGLLASGVGLVVVGEEKRIAQKNEQTALEQKGIAEEQKSRAQLAEMLADANFKRAEAERRTAVAVQRFLQDDLIMQVSPWEQFATSDQSKKGRFDPTMRELLDRAAEGIAGEKLERAFPNQPQVQGELLQTIADAYIALGSNEKGIAQQRRAVDVLRQGLGKEDPRAIIARVRLSRSFLQGDKLPEAAAEISGALQSVSELVAKHDPSDPESSTMKTAGEVLDACNAFWSKGTIRLASEPSIPLVSRPLLVANIALGLKAMNDMLPRLKQTFGDDSERVILLRQAMAAGIGFSGRTKEAIKEAEEVLAAAERRFPPDDFRTITLQMNLGRLYADDERDGAYISAMTKAYESCLRKFGPDHPHTMFAAKALAIAHFDRGDQETGLALMERSYQAFESRLGESDPETMTSRMSLASGYQDVGRPHLAVPLYEKAREIIGGSANPDRKMAARAGKLLGESHIQNGERERGLKILKEQEPEYEKLYGKQAIQTYVVRNLHGYHESKTGDAAAVARYEALVNEAESKLGVDSANARAFRINLLGVYDAHRLHEKAAALGERNLQSTLKNRGANDARTWEDRHSLAKQSLALNRFDAAIELASANLRAAEENAGRGRPQAHVYRHRRATMLSKAGRTEEAIKEFAAAVERGRTDLGEPALFANFLVAVAEDLTSAGRHADAEPLLREVVGIRERNQPDRWRTFNAKAMLGICLVELNRNADAKPLLTAGYEGMKSRDAAIPRPSRHRLVGPLTALARISTDDAERKKWQSEKSAVEAKLNAKPTADVKPQEK